MPLGQVSSYATDCKSVRCAGNATLRRIPSPQARSNRQRFRTLIVMQALGGPTASTQHARIAGTYPVAWTKAAISSASSSTFSGISLATPRRTQWSVEIIDMVACFYLPTAIALQYYGNLLSLLLPKAKCDLRILSQPSISPHPRPELGLNRVISSLNSALSWPASVAAALTSRYTCAAPPNQL